ncbi:MAG: hypothetical protein ABFE07_26375 [Armatimonadia bacterium]
MRSLIGLIDSFALRPDEASMGELVQRVVERQPSDEDLAHLAIVTAQSGEKILEVRGATSADIASTGGPSSLSTLLCPLYLTALGYTVPKLGVPGRPAGGVDVLACIPGYRTVFSAVEAQHLLKHNRYLHCIASDAFVPLDKSLFSFRKRNNRVDVPALAVASLLAKKLAAGVTQVGLDVRVAPHGNFGHTFPEAAEHALTFCRVAALIDRHAVCFLSDASRPYQPFIGRGEALAALWSLFSGNASEWLRSHDDTCYAMVRRLHTLAGGNAPGGRPGVDALCSVFADNLQAQGSSYERFAEYAESVMACQKYEITSPQDGFVSINLDSIRETLVRLQDTAAGADARFADPCGIILARNTGTYARKGELLATLRSPLACAPETTRAVVSALAVGDETISDCHFQEVRCG